MKLDFIKPMLRREALELRQMNKFAEGCSVIRSETNELMSSSPLTLQSSNEVEALKLRFYKAEQKESELLKIRAGVRWREEGEKSTSYFLSGFKARVEEAVMHSIRVGKDLTLVGNWRPFSSSASDL